MNSKEFESWFEKTTDGWLNKLAEYERTRMVVLAIIVLLVVLWVA